MKAEKIPVDAGVGVVFKGDDRVEYVTVPDEGARTVTYSITSYKGVSNGVHWYCSLHTHCLRVKVLHIPRGVNTYGKKVGEICWITGAFERYMPQHARSLDIDVERGVTKEDRDSGLFENYRVGSTTERWNSYEELQKAVKKLFRQRFGKGWKLVAHTSNRNYKNL